MDITLGWGRWVPGGFRPVDLTQGPNGAVSREKLN